MNSILTLLVFQLSTGIPHQSVKLASEITHWDAEPIAMTETTSGTYRLEVPEPWLHELQYKFIVDGNWIADPANPAQVPDGHGGNNSVLDLKFEEDPLLRPQPAREPMARSTLVVKDPSDQIERPLFILSPPEAKRHSVTLYFQDGGDYLERTGIANLLTNISGRDGLPFFTAVFVPPRDRFKEYKNSDTYVDFLVGTVVPSIERAFPHTGHRPEHRLLIGPSLGGLITFYSALLYPNIFGNAASQSGSFWFETDKILELLRLRGSTAPRLYADVGLYEGAEMLEVNRRAAYVASQAGCDIYFREFPSTHDWISWRNRLQLILRHFFGHRPQMPE